MKEINTTSVESQEMEAVKAEVGIMKKLNHPYIIKIKDHFFMQKNGKYIIIMTFAESILLCRGRSCKTNSS
jgi:serine/threonine protein kinase